MKKTVNITIHFAKVKILTLTVNANIYIYIIIIYIVTNIVHVNLEFVMKPNKIHVHEFCNVLYATELHIA
jgi:hypothetical protein